MPLNTAAHRLLNLSYFASIVFEIRERSQMDDAQAQIESVLRQKHRPIVPDQFDFQVQSQKRLIDTQLLTFARVTFFMRWIALSALGVSSLSVFAITWIAVRNRNEDIGTRRAIGATRFDVILQILSENGIGACLGSSFGFLLAYLALRIIDARVMQTFVFDWKSASTDVLLSISLYSVFTFCSGIRAIRILPVVALRSE